MPKDVPLPSFELIYAQIRQLYERMGQELGTVEAAVFFPERANFFEKDDLFGKAFHDTASNEINREIKAAGNCLAADLHAAAVFHLMRVAEAGLRALASERGYQGALPMEYMDWGKLIKWLTDELEKQRTTVVFPAPGPARDAELEYYNGLVESLNYLKDAYRNPAAHFRGHYDINKAHCVFDDVKRFMLRLATKVTLK